MKENLTAIGLVLGILVLVTLSLPFALGIETLTYNINSNVSIRETCYNNGSLCSGSALCNITVFNPKGLNLVNNLAMTQDPSLAFFNYTLDSSLVDTVGFYRYDIVCFDSGLKNFGSFNLQVTAGGLDPSLPQVITNGFILAILLFTFIFNVWGFTRLKWTNRKDGQIITINYMKHVKTFLFFTAYMQLLFIVWVGWSMSQQLIYLDFAQSLMRAIFWVLMSGVLPFTVGLIVFTIMFLITDKKLEKMLVRGIPIR